MPTDSVAGAALHRRCRRYRNHPGSLRTAEKHNHKPEQGDKHHKHQCVADDCEHRPGHRWLRLPAGSPGRVASCNYPDDAAERNRHQQHPARDLVVTEVARHEYPKARRSDNNGEQRESATEVCGMARVPKLPVGSDPAPQYPLEYDEPRANRKMSGTTTSRTISRVMAIPT